MQSIALAHDHRESAGKETERAAEDMKDQERESQAGTNFQASPMTFRAEEDTWGTMRKFRMRQRDRQPVFPVGLYLEVLLRDGIRYSLLGDAASDMFCSR
jgi:hypothetical protein